MYWFSIVLVACGLAMDAFAVALAASASGRVQDGRAAFRISFHFGLFQFLMPIIGWALAYDLHTVLSACDHWIAFGLLGFVGTRMVHSGFGGNPQEFQHNPTRGFSLLALSVATSIDALAVGFGIGLLGGAIVWLSVIIGIVTAALSLLGIAMGGSLGPRVGGKMEIIGGIILIFIGVQTLFSHLG